MFSSQPPLSDMERIALFIRLIDAFPKGHPLKRYRGDVYFEVNNFHLLFSAMERRGWTSGFINQQIDAYLASLEPLQITAEEAWTEKLRAAVHEFDNYQLLVNQLNRHDGIDAPTPGTRALPEHPIIEQITLLLHYLAAEQDIPNSGDAMLLELLHASWFHIPPMEITGLTIALADRQSNETSLRRLLHEKANTPPRDLFTPAVHEGLKKASAAIEKLTGMAPHTSLLSLLENMFRETGIEAFINNSPDQIQQQVAGFIGYIKEEARLNPAMDLQLLVKLITLLQHSSFTGLLQLDDNPENIIAVLGALYRPAASSPGYKTEIALAPALASTVRPQIARLNIAVENKLVQRFVLHVTALNSYLRCPLEFYFHNLLRVPSSRNEATEFGSAVHHALELLFRKMQTDKDVFPSKATFISDFEGYMHQHRKSFTSEQFNRRLLYGQDVLNNYYDEYARSWNTIVAVERNMRILLDGIPLKGKIDKLEFRSGRVNVVDYKTGDPEKSKARLQPPNDGSPNGGDYWRQAVFYKILVDNYQQNEWKVASSEFDFIEPDKKGQYHKVKLIIPPEDVAIVTGQINTVWQRIQQRDFYTGCGKPYCHWCHFVKTYDLAEALHQ